MAKHTAIKIEVPKDLTRKLKKLSNKSAVRTVVRYNGGRLQNAMTRRAEFTRGYQTGTTKRSIRTTFTNGGYTAEVGPTTEYAPYLEVGTRFMDAQPFVRPALREVQPNFIHDLERLVKSK